jgi:hypothetical protein
MPSSSQHHSSPQNVYPDHPLPSGSNWIRLVELQPGQIDDPVSCTLARIKLPTASQGPKVSEDISYEALSYTWGPFSIRSITLNGHKDFRVTDNLDSALRYLRRTDHQRVLWIDALSINQNDLPERNSQVGRMLEIYSRAIRVVVWLGSPPLFSRASLAYDDIAVVCNLLAHGNLAWWKRVWTVQEAAVAKRLSVQYGSREMPWKGFVVMYENVMRRFAPETTTEHLGIEQGKGTQEPVTESESFPEALRTGQEAFSFVASIQNGNFGGHSLHEWLRITEHRAASDPRDTIFGVLGLVYPPSHLDVLAADYRKTADRIFMEATFMIIRNEESLDILTDGWPRDTHTSPWVPRYSASRRVTASLASLPLYTERMTGPSTKPQCHLIEAHDPIDARLEIGGHFIDRICSTYKDFGLVDPVWNYHKERHSPLDSERLRRILHMLETLRIAWKKWTAENSSAGFSDLLIRKLANKPAASKGDSDLGALLCDQISAIVWGLDKLHGFIRKQALALATMVASSAAKTHAELDDALKFERTLEVNHDRPWRTEGTGSADASPSGLKLLCTKTGHLNGDSTLAWKQLQDYRLTLWKKRSGILSSASKPFHMLSLRKLSGHSPLPAVPPLQYIVT